MSKSGRTNPLPTPAALLLALRPKQWIKNLLLFAGIFFTIGEGHTFATWCRAGVAFVLFCLLSGATYLINDIRDREADRQHPKKRNRPIASGALPVPFAAAFAAVSIPLTLAIGWLVIGIPFALTALAYTVVTLAYSYALKNQVLVDVFTLAALFVLRAVAGSFAISVRPSEWLLLCTFLLALFIGLMKRRAELAALGGGTPTRSVLAEYSLPFLDHLGTVTATTTVVSYLLYTFLSETSHKHPWLMVTAPFVLYGLFRYLYLAYRKEQGEAPETLVLADGPLRVNIILWLLSVILAMKV